MHGTIIGTLIFLAALFVGIQSTAFSTDVAAQFSLPADIPEPGSQLDPDQAPKAPAGIRVSYIGVNDSTLRFLIYNGSTESVSCLGYSGLCASPELLINGLDANAWVCMSGSPTYEIKPGDSVEMIVTPEDFARVPGKSEMVVVGYKPLQLDAQDQYFAEPIVLPPSFRNSIRKSLTQLGE